MSVSQWLGASWGDLAMVVVSTVAIYVALIAYNRVSGLRSFSKMSSFDFAMTVAVGSLLASVAVSSTVSLAHGLLGLAVLFLLQAGVGALRRVAVVKRAIDNRPSLLMAGTQILHDNLRANRVTEADVRAKLREANVIDLRQVRAVVMETTGDISVLHADPDGPELDPVLLSDVVGHERLRG